MRAPTFMRFLDRDGHGVPVYLEPCPVHGFLVPFDNDERLIGRCQGCATEAAAATRQITGRSA